MWDRCGSRQAGFTQVTVGTTEVFHCARRERVLLRDILRFGTATIFSSDLLNLPVDAVPSGAAPTSGSLFWSQFSPPISIPTSFSHRGATLASCP